MYMPPKVRTMFNGIPEEHQVHVHHTRCVVVLIQGLHHVLLEGCDVSYVLIHIVHTHVVTWSHTCINSDNSTLLIEYYSNCSLICVPVMIVNKVF